MNQQMHTTISQIITLLHVSTLSCHPQAAFNQYLAKLHQYFVLWTKKCTPQFHKLSHCYIFGHYCAIIIKIKDWALWSVASPELQLLAPTVVTPETERIKLSLGNDTLVVVERSGWRRVLGASKPRPSAKGAHYYRKLACLEDLKLATAQLTQQGTGYPSWGQLTQLRISKRNTGHIVFFRCTYSKVTFLSCRAIVEKR